MDRSYSRDIELKSPADHSIFVAAPAYRAQGILSRAVVNSWRFRALGSGVASSRPRMVWHRAGENEPAPKAVIRQAFRSAISCRPRLVEI